MFLFFGITSIFKEDYFLLYLQKQEGRSQGKDGGVPSRHFSSQPIPKEKSSVFHVRYCCHLEGSRGLVPCKRGPALSHLLSGGSMLMNRYPSMNAKPRAILEPGGS